MKRDQLHVLIQKYFLGTITEIEKKRLEDWYSSYEEPAVWELEADEEIQTVKNRILQKVLTETERGEVKKRSKLFYSVRVAAALLVIAITGFVVSRYVANTDSNIIANVPDQQAENRFLLLPDSSRVVLRPGSSLEYVSDFEGKTREVSLKGEAYFDIQSRPDQPFIIHTGQVKTRVLGTKFTVKASGDDVGVRVKEGKVQVSNETKVLGHLVANEEITYSKKGNRTTHIPVPSDVKPDWTIADDMDFDGLSFRVLVEKLERRYGVRILFENESLSSCLMSGRFEGSETIQEVLKTLCDIRSASFIEVSVGKFKINGLGCP